MMSRGRSISLTRYDALARLLSATNEAENRRAQVRALAFPKQLAFLDDSSRLKCALCTRRAGKSYGIGLDILLEHATYPGASSLYIGLTRETAKRVMWKDILGDLDSKLRWGLTPNKSELSYRSPNGAVTYFIGADADKGEMDKALGQKYRKVWIDEAASYTIDLVKLVYTKLWPAMRDYRGVICMLGTPGDYLKIGDDYHLFYAATTGRDSNAQWSRHFWSAADNPHMRAAYLEEIERVRQTNPRRTETPGFRQMELGEWVTDGSGYVYRYNEDRNVIAASEVPPLTSHVVAIDLGWHDATAFTVTGWRAHDPTLYVLRSWKKPEMTLTDVAAHIKELRKLYPTAQLVVDAAAKQSVMELAQRIGEPLHPTEKAGKEDQIRMMNSDLIEGKVRLVAGQCDDLVGEWQSLVWDERAVGRVEDQRCRNDAADSALYAWRYARPYVESGAAPKKQTEEERIAEWVNREAERVADPEGWEDDDGV